MNLLYIKWGSTIGNSWIWECLLIEGVPLHAENSSGVGPRAVLEDRMRANESVEGAEGIPRSTNSQSWIPI